MDNINSTDRLDRASKLIEDAIRRASNQNIKIKTIIIRYEPITEEAGMIGDDVVHICPNIHIEFYEK